MFYVMFPLNALDHICYLVMIVQNDKILIAGEREKARKN